MRVVFLLLLSLQLLCVSGSTDIEFEGFTLNTYYTNGVNDYTELTCNATSNTYTIINTTWIDITENTDTGSVLRFEDITTEVIWGDQRDYFCRAFYQTDPVMYQDSDSITVRIKCELNSTLLRLFYITIWENFGNNYYTVETRLNGAE